MSHVAEEHIQPGADAVVAIRLQEVPKNDVIYRGYQDLPVGQWPLASKAAEQKRKKCCGYSLIGRWFSLNLRSVEVDQGFVRAGRHEYLAIEVG